MGLMNKVEYIDGKINEIKDKLDIPMSSSLQEVVDSVGKFNTQEKTVRPETSSVYVSPDKGYDGLSRVTVSPIRAAYIDDLKPDIIKNGAKVLEMTGTYGPSSQIKTVYPSTETQKIYPDSGIEYLSMVQVQGVNYTIDSDITPENIDVELQHNFSGRSFHTKKTAQVIISEIINQYQSALSNSIELKKIAEKQTGRLIVFVTLR